MLRCSAVWMMWLLAALGTTAAADPPGIPYSALHQALAPGLQLHDYPRLRAVQRIESKRAEVRPDQIRIWINRPEGPLEIPVQPDGQVQVPLRDDWRVPEVTVSSNQPRGSLSVSLSVEVVPPTTLDWPWSEFEATLQETQRALPLLGGVHAGAEVAGIEFRMPGSGDTLTVIGPQGEDLLVADARHRIVLRRAVVPMRPDALIRFSRAPLQAFPFLRLAQ